MGEPARLDFGAVVDRHELPREDRVGFVWVVIFSFGAVFLAVPPLILDPRQGPPRAVYFLIWGLFVLGAARAVASRYFSTPTVVLERGLFLPAYLPRHFVRVRRRAVPFKDLLRVELDDTPLRSGTHLFVTARGPVRCAKAYFPPARKLAEAIKVHAPQVEVALIDRKGRERRYAPVVKRRPRGKEPKGERTDGK